MPREKAYISYDSHGARNYALESITKSTAIPLGSVTIVSQSRKTWWNLASIRPFSGSRNRR
jgi:hypothetical protein